MSTTNISIIIQARTGSSRLPGKVLKELLPGRSLLSCMLERIKRSQLATEIIVATSDNSADRAIAEEAQKCSCHFFCGSENDVLGRFLEAAKKYKTDIIVRLCADSPLHDAAIVDACIQRYLDNCRKVDLVCNILPPTFPYGTAVEVFSIDVLMRIDRLTVDLQLREHVTQYVHQNPHLFKIDNVTHSENLSALRWAVDTASDFAFAQSVYSRLYDKNSTFSWLDVCKIRQLSG